MSGVEALARALVSVYGHYAGVYGHAESDPEVAEIRAEQVLHLLSPADKLAIAGITEERLTTALHVAEIDCNPIMPVGGFYETPLAEHVAASNHDGSAERLLAALATPVTPEGGEL